MILPNKTNNKLRGLYYIDNSKTLLQYKPHLPIYKLHYMQHWPSG